MKDFYFDELPKAKQSQVLKQLQKIENAKLEDATCKLPGNVTIRTRLRQFKAEMEFIDKFGKMKIRDL